MDTDFHGWGISPSPWEEGRGEGFALQYCFVYSVFAVSFVAENKTTDGHK